jgi:uncharacterized protein
MVIDAYSHIIPPKYAAALEKLAASGKISAFNSLYSGEFHVKGMVNLEERFKLMDKIPGIRNVVSVTGPFLENVVGPADAIDLARLANDELAEIVARYPERFAAGLAFLPLNDIDATLIEIDRSIKDLKLRGIEIGTDVAGKPLDSPEFMPIYEKMEQYDLPIYIHPSKNNFFPDYPGETGSKYNLFGAIGWPHATSLAMLRLSCSGVLEKYPKLKFVTHHAGGTVPHLAKRIEGTDRHQLPKTTTDYLRLFYNDTAVQGNIPNLNTAVSFFGTGHILFGTDFPFGNEVESLHAIENWDIPAAQKKQILEDNAKVLLHLE